VLTLSGGWLQSTALGWLVLELTDSPFWLGLVSASGSLPILLFSLFAGVVADHHDKRKILLLAQGVACIQAILLATLTYFGRISLFSILTLALVLGIASSFEVPTRQSFFSELVGPGDLPNAIALNSMAFNGTRMVAPAIAGSLIGSVGIAVCFFANAISYLAAFAGLLAIRRNPPHPEPATRSTLGEIREGLQWIRHDIVTRTSVLYIALASILVFPFTVLLPVFARDLLHIGAGGLGWLYAATGVGALLGGLAMTTAANRFPRGRILVFSGSGFSIFVALFALSTPVWMALLFLSAAGFCMILSTASANSLVQERVPDQLRGRVMAVYVVMFLGMTPVGSVIAGTAAGIFSPRISLAVTAMLMLTLMLTVIRRSEALRGAA
jgi:MFS family permease